jgi:hypothetical protein
VPEVGPVDLRADFCHLHGGGVFRDPKLSRGPTQCPSKAWPPRAHLDCEVQSLHASRTPLHRCDGDAQARKGAHGAFNYLQSDQTSARLQIRYLGAQT